MMWELSGQEASEIDGLPPDDRGFLLGDGVFETFRMDDDGIRFGVLHEASLQRACSALDLPMPDWRTISDTFRRLKPAGRHVGKVMVTRGSASRGLSPVDPAHSRVFLTLHDFQPPAASFSLQTVSVRRSATSLAARFKTMSYADNLAARREAVARGGDMALILTSDGALSGADCASLFWIRDHCVHFPSEACAVREGVTRTIVRKTLERDIQGYVYRSGRHDPEALHQADAVFIGNALIGIRPVHAIDGQQIACRHDLLDHLQLPNWN